MTAAIVVERAYVLFFRAPIGADVVRAIEAAIEARDVEDARALAAAARPATAAGVYEAALGGGEGAVEEIEVDARAALSARLGALAVLARVASYGGLLVAIAEISALFRPDRGLEGLAAGRLESIVATKALFAMAVGTTTWIVAFAAVRALEPARRARLAEIARAARTADGPR